MVVRIIATRSSTPVSWLIRLMTNSPYSHLGIKLSSKHMIDSNWGGVKVRHIPKKYDEYTIEMTPEGIKRANNWIKRQINKKYDFIGTIGVAFYNAIGKKRYMNIFR